MSAPDITRTPSKRPSPTSQSIILQFPSLRSLDTLFANLPASTPSSFSHQAHTSLLRRLLHLHHQHYEPATAETPTIHLFDNFAYRIASNESQPWRVQPWETQVVAACYTGCNEFEPRGSDVVFGKRGGPAFESGTVEAGEEKEEEKKNVNLQNVVLAVFNAVAKEGDIVDVEVARVMKARIRERLRPWMMQELAGQARSMEIQRRVVDNKIPTGRAWKQPKLIQLEPGNEAGLSMTVLRLPEDDYRDGQELDLTVKGGSQACITAQTRVCSGKGYAVISTLEGTLWHIGLMDNPFSILRHVFSEPAKPVQGMLKLFQYLQKQLHNPPFWYISTAPYCLYPFLRDFRDQHLPFGVMLMRNAQWRTTSELVAGFMQNTEEYKVEQLERIYQIWPKRSVVLVGSASQCDVEAFAQVYSRHPSWIQAILLRRDGPRNSPDSYTDEALQDILRGVPHNIWHIFSDPAEIHNIISSLGTSIVK